MTREIDYVVEALNGHSGHKEQSSLRFVLALLDSQFKMWMVQKQPNRELIVMSVYRPMDRMVITHQKVFILNSIRYIKNSISRYIGKV